MQYYYLFIKYLLILKIFKLLTNIIKTIFSNFSQKLKIQKTKMMLLLISIQVIYIIMILEINNGYQN